VLDGCNSLRASLRSVLASFRSSSTPPLSFPPAWSISSAVVAGGQCRRDSAGLATRGKAGRHDLLYRERTE